ncbi:MULTISPECIES: DUF4180 domain-containing protein [Rathayibacter]|jgi:hypothetical protein|uniref:DUF4180 domain-containing protein n=2 Tax=Rathayibacter festucae TaxID=110937 RepID=A0A3T0T2I4_9MICO|nr:MULTISPECIES: DUF4180 domain-containing protein [Rathayibacter]AZZ52838.1 DUF4180 domain-containing protein [Rathayibacter festucae DSM 15932]MCJ1671922.1 DUF4180 domain-containing protein [Rathayibacter sp. VKM Ac-2929]MCJ1686700.1 DUF4180 domain-containing protein [Rathayibacter sp. VKM Ac-2927]MCJ1701405.1 DUF4180 domain-containing protein [Rathayibacter festucae]MCJ1702843.1 DUF4180 domain-containing protein [Rathayibacter sp. VKM Ac-2926]
MRTETRQGVPLLLVDDDGPALSTSEDALAVIGEIYGSDAETIVVPVGRLDPEFFRLRSGIAGEFVQRFVMYGKRLVVVGDITEQVSASSTLHDFVVESNRGDHLWFVPALDALDARLRDSATAEEPGADGGVEPTPGPAL